NSQPWLFRVTESRIDLFADPARNIGAVDPYRREMYIGLGCALENLLLAADARGFAWRLALMPDRANAAHAARIDVAPAPRATSELYDAIPRRHTNRGPYDQARAAARERAQCSLLAHRDSRHLRRDGDGVRPPRRPRRPGQRGAVARGPGVAAAAPPRDRARARAPPVEPADRARGPRAEPRHRADVR